MKAAKGWVITSVVALFCAVGCARQHKSPYDAYTKIRSDIPIEMSLPAPYARPVNIYHVVGPQETLWRISKSYDVPIETLMRVNQLTDATQIKNGQRLLIPNTYGPKPVIPLYPAERWSHIVVHHTATDAGNAFRIDQMHHGRGFWNGLGYHFLIDNGTDGKLSGQIEVGPRWVKQLDGAHANASGMNQKGIGVALVGNFSENYVSGDQFRSLIYLVRILKSYYNIPDQNVIRHRDVPGKSTECPGAHFPWYEFKRHL